MKLPVDTGYKDRKTVDPFFKRRKSLLNKEQKLAMAG